MNHKYKVGDKGFVRNGLSAYEVALIDPSVEKPLIVKLSHPNGEVAYYQYRIDGRFLRDGNRDAWDLIPPEEFVWVNWLRHPTLGVASVAFDTEEKAKNAPYKNSTWEPIKIAVKTEVPC